jgi:hypothetical protein
MAMTATEFEAKQHLYVYAIQKTDAEIKQIIDSLPEVVRYRVAYQNGSETSEMNVVEQTAMEQYATIITEAKTKLDNLRSKRKTLVEKYSQMEDDLETFLMS